MGSYGQITSPVTSPDSATDRRRDCVVRIIMNHIDDSELCDKLS